MQPNGFKAALREHLLDLCWSLWEDLGVDGRIRHHADWGVDVEPLIIFTALIGHED